MVYCIIEIKQVYMEVKMKKIHDKTYPLRVNKIVLESAMKYCSDNKLTLSEELRGMIDKFDLMNRRNESKKSTTNS